MYFDVIIAAITLTLHVDYPSKPGERGEPTSTGISGMGVLVVAVAPVGSSSRNSAVIGGTEGFDIRYTGGA